MTRLTAALAAGLASLALLMPVAGAHATPHRPLVRDGTQTESIQNGDTVQAPASTSSSAAVNMGQGAAPASPANGDLWNLSTGLFYRAGGVTYGPLVGCAAPLSVVSGSCTVTTNGLALSFLAQIGGNSYLGNQSSTTGNVTAYAFPTCASGQFLVYNPLSVPPLQCATPSTVPSGSNPFAIGSTDITSFIGAPAASALPVNTFGQRTDLPILYHLLTSSASVPTVVQAAAGAGDSVGMTATPAPGDWLVGFCSNYPSTPGAGSGWFSVSSRLPLANDPSAAVTRKLATSGESTTQTPCSGAAASIVFEVSGVSDWALQYQGQVSNVNTAGGNALAITTTTTSANTLALGAWAARNGSTGGSVTGLTQATSNAAGITGSLFVGVAGAAGAFPTTGSAINATGTIPTGSGIYGTLILLVPGASSWAQVSDLSVIQNAGLTISTWPQVLNCVAPVSCSASTGSNGLDTVAITSAAAPTGANPTATAGDTAVNGTAATFMRSDAAPAVQKGSSSQFGIVKVDGTTITSASGVISASVTGAAIHGTPTAGNCTSWFDATHVQDAGAACGGGGGGTTNNYYAGSLVLIQSQTLSAAAASVSFTVPSGYQDLVLVANARGDTAALTTNLKLTFNGDTGANYDYQYVAGINATPSASSGQAQTSELIGDIPAATATAGRSGSHIVDIPNYAGTTFDKQFTTTESATWGTAAGNMISNVLAGNWRSTAAINSLSLFPAAGNFAAGSTFQLYARASTNVTVNPQPGLPVICEVVTSGSQTSVTVGGGSGACPTLPSTYRDLKVVVTGRGTTAATSVTGLVQFNGDTGANYDLQQMFGDNASVGASQGLAQTSFNFGDFVASTGAAGVANTTDFTIYNYAGTGFQKTILGHGGLKRTTTASDIFTITRDGWWRSTAAITSMALFPSAGAWQDGSIITVYGIGGSPTATLPVIPPQGRLSLTSGQAVPTTDVTAAPTIYWVPMPGGMLPVGNVMYRPGQLSFALNTTAHVSGGLYDIGAFNNAGSLALCTAPAWTSSTARSAAISQDATNGIWENTASLTCTLSGSTSTTTIAAGNWTYLGTFEATANGQTGMAMHPAAASGGSNNFLALYNAYNRVTITAINHDNEGSCAYNSTAFRALCASNSNRISFVDGLQQSTIRGAHTIIPGGAAGIDAYVGMDLDSTSATPGLVAQNTLTTSVYSAITANDTWAPQLGLHFVQAVQASSGNISFFTSATTPTRQLEALQVTLEMGLWIEPANDNAPWRLPAGVVLLPALVRRRERRAA